MLASVVLSVLCLIALQVVLVVKVADWLSLPAGQDRSDSRNLADRPAGRYAGLA